MTTEEFMLLWRDIELRQFVVDCAKRHSRRTENQEDDVQEAWLAISCAPSGYEIRCYKRVAYRAIYSSYWQRYKQQLLSQSYNQHIAAWNHKTPERPTDNDKSFMDKVKGRNWRD